MGIRASLVAQLVRNLPAVQETQVWSLGREDPLEKGVATHSDTLAWRIPWTEEPGGLQSMGSQRVGHNCATNFCFQFSSVHLLSHVWLFATPWIAACQASLSITNSRSLVILMFIESVMPSNHLILYRPESVMPSNHLILYRPLLLLPLIFPSIRVFSNESVLSIRWPKYQKFSCSISPSNEYSGLISLQSKGLSKVFSNTTVQKHQFFGA